MIRAVRSYSSPDYSGEKGLHLSISSPHNWYYGIIIPMIWYYVLIYIFVCECVLACGMCTCVRMPVHTHVHTCGGQTRMSGVCFVTLLLSLLRQGLSVDLEPGWQPASPSHPPVSTYACTRAIGVTEICTQVLALAQCVLLPMEYLPNCS